MEEGEAQEEVVRDVGREGWRRTHHARRQQRLNERKGRSSGGGEEKRLLQDLKDLSKNKLGRRLFFLKQSAAPRNSPPHWSKGGGILFTPSLHKWAERLDRSGTN